VVDDKACMDISKYTDEGCVADIYVEGSSSNGDSQDDETEGEESEYEQGTNEGSEEGSDEGFEEGSDELEEDEVDIDLGSGVGQVAIRESNVQVQKQVEAVKKFYSPSKGGASSGKGKTAEKELSSSDCDFVPGDDESSREDEEVKEILKKFKEFKKKLKSGQFAQLDDVFVDDPSNQSGDCTIIEDDGHVTPYVNSSDDEESFDDMGSGDEVITKENKFPRFNKKDPFPKFYLGMKFRGKKCSR